MLIIQCINGDGLDNRKANLRIVDICTQQRNIRVSRNKAGVVGLRYLPKVNAYEGRFKFNKVVYRRSFSANVYHNACQLALDWLNKTKDEIIKPDLRTKNCK